MIRRLSLLRSILQTLPRVIKRALVILVDVIFCFFSVLLAFYLRLDAFPEISKPVISALVISIAISLPIFSFFGLYRAIFRYSGMSTMVSLVQASVLYGFIFAAIFSLYGVSGVPRTIGLIQPILLFLVVSASRVIARLWLGDWGKNYFYKQGRSQALIYGAGSSGRQLASIMINDSKIKIIGFLDDDDQLHGQRLNGLPVFNPSLLPTILNTLPIADILLALPKVSRKRRYEIIISLKKFKLAVRTIPNFLDIARGKNHLGDLQELDLYDLLGREPVSADYKLLNFDLFNKTILVTGAGGSIGSELCRQILKFNPKKLLIVDISEFALYQIHQELINLLSVEFRNSAEIISPVSDRLQGESDAMSMLGSIEVVPLLASVCDRVRMDQIMNTWKPNIVYHAAAYKHVPLVEHNAAEGIRNNVFGTLVCAEVALQHTVDKFILISTDKAVRPTSIMGVTKRIAEMVLQALADGDSKTLFSMVRFGNVLGSSGSVVPLFREQIKNGGPITLTHADITRYFMMIPEAAQLVIQAGAMSKGGDVFVLDMGTPVRIIDLARRMVELSGLTVRDKFEPNGDIELVVTNLRPGEKLYEELLIGNSPKSTQHPFIMMAHEEFLTEIFLKEQLEKLKSAIDINDLHLIRSILQQIVVNYQPDDNLVDWVHVAQGDEGVAKSN